MRYFTKQTISLLAGALLIAGPAIASSAQSESKFLQPKPALMAPLGIHTNMLGLCRAGDTLVAVGGHGAIFLASASDPMSWSQVAVPVRTLLTRCDFADVANGWAVGHDETIVHTTDGGQHWQLQYYDPKEASHLMSVIALDDQHAIAVGTFGLYLSTEDGGQTWQEAPSDMLRNLPTHIYDISELHNGDLLLVGENGLVSLSTDRGQSWHGLESPFQGSYFGATTWGKNGALIYGIGGVVYVIKNVEDPQWIEVEDAGGASLYGGREDAPRHAVLVGISGRIMQVDSSFDISQISVAHLQRVPVQGDVHTEALTAASLGSFTAIESTEDNWIVSGEDGVFVIDKQEAQSNNATVTEDTVLDGGGDDPSK